MIEADRSPITHVAIRFGGAIYSLASPNRHHHVIWKIIAETGVSSVDVHADDQGFLDASGRYLDRKQALSVALSNGQVRAEGAVRCEMLFSEDVW